MLLTKERKVIHSKGREIISSIMEKSDESQNNCLKYPLNQAKPKAQHLRQYQ
jgi:hypothetical protein